MAIFVIGDLHLSFGTNKPMDIFGWGNHSEKIKLNWIKNVTAQDTVILPGDFSWAMTLNEAYKDFEFISSLPGRKILSKGNHDYWWNGFAKMTNFLRENNFNNIDFLQNNSYLVESKLIVGTRGWATNSWKEEENYKILRRENERLKLSIEDGIKNFRNYSEIVCFLHYPPIFKGEVPDEINFVKIMQNYNIHKCFYGHLHSESHKEAFIGEKDGIHFELISSDYLKFELKQI